MNKIAENISQRELDSYLTQLGNQPGGLDKIASLALQPVMEDVLYESKARQIFAQKVLDPGEEAVLDGDVRVPAAALSVEGLPYQIEAKSSRFRIDTSPLSATAIVKWNESNYRKFDMLDWTQARAKSSLLEQEDTRAISVLDFASELYNPVVTSAGKLFADKIVEAKTLVAANLRTAAAKLIIPTTMEKDLQILQYSDGISQTGTNPYTPEYNNEVLRKGVVGSLYGLEVISIPKRQDGSDIIDPNTAYVVGPAELVGTFVIRTEITPRTQVDVRQEGDLICFWEDIGIFCRYSKGIVKIKVS